jgi:hypothetical protein
MEYVILKAMSKDPAARFQTAREMADEIEAMLSGGAAARRTESTGSVTLGTSPARAVGIGSTISLPKTESAPPRRTAAQAPETRRSRKLAAAVIVAACLIALGVGTAFLIGAWKSSKPGSGTASGPATVSVNFDHHIVRGTLTVWMDGEKVLTCPLQAKKSKEIIPKLKLSHETIRKTLTVPAGNHTFQVNVYGTDPDVNETGHLAGRIRPGDRTSLVIRVQRITNRMSLGWE